MTECRWNSDAGDYLDRDGNPCHYDEYGDPTHHCTARRRCAWHVGAGELTCARCITETRNHIRRIVTLSALLLPAAIANGIDSDAATMHGPAVDPEAWSWRKATARRTGTWHASLTEEDDERHPLRVLSTWARMIAEGYGHDLPDRLTVSNCADYLERRLPRIAQDPEQDFALMCHELKVCAKAVETAIGNGDQIDRGALCPECKADGVHSRLRRRYGHWCEDDDCAKVHHADESGDVWTCRNSRDHEWTHEAYTARIADRA